MLADRGFDITDELALHGASLAIPSFTKGKDQLSQAKLKPQDSYHENLFPKRLISVYLIR